MFSISGLYGSLDMAGRVVIPPSAIGVASVANSSGHQGHETTVDSARAGVHPGSVTTDIASAGRRIAVVHGQVRWLDPSISSVAAENGPARAALTGYATYGEDIVLHMRGPFALAILDADLHSALLAVDRLGIRAMCFGLAQSGIAFGSTADDVIALQGGRGELNLQAVYDYLYCQVVPSPETIYAGVEKLLPAERVVFRAGKLTRDFYWHQHYAASTRLSEREMQEEFRGLLRQATARAIDGIPRDRIGAFLSGGTDSSTVTGVLTELAGGPAATYSIGFKAEGFDEISYARIAARHFGASPHEYYVTPHDVTDAITVIAQAYDEPFGNASAVPTYFCARLAREDGRSLLLAGDGGDELFGGNARYAKQKIFEWFHAIPGPLRRGVAEPIVLALPSAIQTGPILKLQSYVRQARVPLPERLESYNIMEREVLETIFEPEFLRAIDVRRPSQLAREVYFRTASDSAIDRMMHLDLKITLADNDLRKVNRMSELAGVEARYPLLDEAIVEFSSRLSPSQKVRGTRLRYFFKEALRGFLPQETITKHKHGFGLPFGLWMQSNPELADVAQSSLKAFARRGWVRKDFVDRLLAAHRDEHATYYGAMIWIVVMLEHWLAVRGR